MHLTRLRENFDIRATWVSRLESRSISVTRSEIGFWLGSGLCIFWWILERDGVFREQADIPNPRPAPS